MTELRLALFTDTYAPEINGVAKTLQRWIAYLERNGIACKVYAPAGPRRAPGYAETAERLASVPFSLYPECRLAMPASAAAERSLLDFRPSVVHVATPFGTGLAGRRLALKHGIPLVASHHTHFARYLPYYNFSWAGALLRRYLHWFHRPCRRVLVPSPSVLEECRRDGWLGLGLWSRGIDAALFRRDGDRGGWLQAHGLPPTCFPVLCAGRLAPEKNLGTALLAFRRFREGTGADARLVLAGDGPQAAELRRSSEQLGLGALFLGAVTQPELQRWMQASGALLFPSPTETFGNVALEAMACGLPVIAADAGALPDLVKDGETGLLCPPGDADAFAAALARLYREPRLRAAISDRAHAYAGTHDWDEVFGRLLEQMTDIGREAPAV
ncbi:glycosyltransferase family 4 protein [Cohnella sp. JJ-181]|uniref:glycosyltransferase family 4 protein n=1 Tax=Cohnella rhizoplanae TaxID=2974897 RepID=UPI0022FF867E|nr:glycosyltransferase family 1 protein [Cohnella sp. JJ-181]CAI6076320.1 GDP-mannose-dependent alpha-mannosyltransferase [Cohnella sp. JJ-181]